ncbi:BZ3500_MvSof-1268-A1-R1_Chr1-3g01599 [Microbotryum saponariae]|uniref:histone deacetylase n=1 Tax=Microbotryum saponariae TaxID=289078 RepID=A0A2X0K9H4_9BASI|nr:BZ3500_MvSof-1268-A1-R1_Chr1-3g01599 [Microbotryum saponariae]
MLTERNSNGNMTSAPVSKRRVAYFHDEDVGAYAYSMGQSMSCEVHPMKPHRVTMAHNLVVNYGLDKHMDMIRPTRATAHEMTRFHTDEFIDMLSRVTPDLAEEMTCRGTRFLIGEDCPAFEGLFEFCSISAGGSLSTAHCVNFARGAPANSADALLLWVHPTGAARRLTDAKADIALNWAGGLHHAKKREASGFCYINDIVLAILELLRYHARVLYIDIDVHHGDGVEEAFFTTDRVMTASFHKFGDFFPGTGALNDRGKGPGKGYSVNFPLKDGIDDQSYKTVFRPVMQAIMDWYRPGAVVLQCGADSLAEDKLGPFNLSMQGHADCVEFMRTFNVPLMILGGGGYTIRNVARTWAYETGVACGQVLSESLPYNDYFEYFGPEFKMNVPASNMENSNTAEYLETTKNAILQNLRNMPFAPSAQMHAVPFDFDSDPGDSDSDLDVRISNRIRETQRHQDEGYVSSDEEGDSLQERYRKLSKSYITSLGSTARGEGPASRRKRAAHKGGDEENGMLDEETDNCAHEPRRPKRTFFRMTPGKTGAGLMLDEPNRFLLGLGTLGSTSGSGSKVAEEWRRGVL